jgi:hypothetical protein
MAASKAEITTLFKELKKSGGNITKFFLHRTWPSHVVGGTAYYKEGQPMGHQQCIYRKVSEHADPEKYPGMVFPLFDLEQWDPENIGKLQHIFNEAARLSVALIMVIHDFCSIKTGQRKRCYPYDACQQGQELANTLGLGHSEHVGFITGGRYHPGEERDHVRWWYARELDKIFELLKAAGNPEMYFLVMSEADYLNPGDTPEAEQDRQLIDLHRWYKTQLNKRGVANDHMIINTSRAGAKMMADAELSKCLFEVHGCNSPEQLKKIKAEYPAVNVVGNGDGPDDHALGNLGTIGNSGRNCSPAQGTDMAAFMIEKLIVMFESFDRLVEALWPANFSRLGFQAWVKAMATRLGLPQYVFVDVCPDSRKLVNEYCPDEVGGMFEAGQEPTTVCDIHKAPTPEPQPQPGPEHIPTKWQKFLHWAFGPHSWFKSYDYPWNKK